MSGLIKTLKLLNFQKGLKLSVVTAQLEALHLKDWITLQVHLSLAEVCWNFYLKLYVCTSASVAIYIQFVATQMRYT